MKFTSWGRIYESDAKLKILQQKFPLELDAHYLAIGSRRSYGDVGLNTNGYILSTQCLTYFTSFDAESGILECESGVILKQIQDVFIPRGWILPVTPGTQLITVGGAIANDVHGKNHHQRGSFGHYVKQIELQTSTQGRIICSREQHKDLFEATVGGVGLTGVILKAQIQLIRVPSPYVKVESIAFTGVQEFLTLTHQSNQVWEYTVSWIDCLSGKNVKGIFMRANHVKLDEINHIKLPFKKTFSIPFKPSFSCVNKLSLKTFNWWYYHTKKSSKTVVQHFYQFQYPLDGIDNWNVLYGDKGFYQYQCVIPWEFATEAIEHLLELIQHYQQGSFLVVLKAFGDQLSEGLLSFPLPGVTLALDFPNQGQTTLDLFKKMDEIVVKYKGRLYLAKDHRMPKDIFMQTYLNISEFEKFRDPQISSDLAKRLFGN